MNLFYFSIILGFCFFLYKQKCERRTINNYHDDYEFV
jgi:hypothetical protein